MTKRKIIIDLESNGLHGFDKIWCIVCKDIVTGEVFKFRPRTHGGYHTEWQEEFLKFIEEVDEYIGHNIIGFDIFHINRLLGTDIKLGKCTDTLVLSRLFRPVSPFKEQLGRLKTDNRLGGHGLEAWGTRLKFPKFDFKDFSTFTEEMLEYCVQDVELNLKVYQKLMVEGKGFSPYSIRLEHKVAHLLAQQERNGFYLDRKAAIKLKDDTAKLLKEMNAELQIIFPPTDKLIRNMVVKYNKDGSMGAVTQRILETYRTTPGYTAVLKDDESYDLFVKEEFNPQSSQQIAKRLLSIGWEPKKFTDKGSPKTDKETLKEAIEQLLEANPENTQLERLADYNIVADRNQKASKWLELVKEDGRVHGKINPIGAGTHRCAHFDDNMANIARVIPGKHVVEPENYDLYRSMEKFTYFDNNKVFLHWDENESTVHYALTGIEGKYGWDSRNCWTAPVASDKCIVGADASGIQLRALAHYMNDPEYTKALLEADIHVVHQEAAGIDTRSKAKTFIYAWLLGAGDEKIGSIVGVTEAEYEDLYSWAETRSVTNIYNLADSSSQNLFCYIRDGLRRKGRKADKRTVAIIIKGFKVKEQFLERTPALKRLRKKDIPAATKQGYLTGIDGRKFWIPSEHLAMSMYLQGFEAVIMKAAMCFYHDELTEKGIPFKQVAFVHDEFQIETTWEHAETVGQAVVNAIKKAGEVLASNCPLDGEYKVGRSWGQTH